MGQLHAGLSTPARLIECECPTAHTITKLGHCGSCHWHNSADSAALIPAPELRGCLTTGHADGTPHDFEWATYADDTCGTGVCRCGTRAIDYYAMVGP